MWVGWHVGSYAVSGCAWVFLGIYLGIRTLVSSCVPVCRVVLVVWVWMTSTSVSGVSVTLLAVCGWVAMWLCGLVCGVVCVCVWCVGMCLAVCLYVGSS